MFFVQKNITNKEITIKTYTNTKDDFVYLRKYLIMLRLKQRAI